MKTQATWRWVAPGLVYAVHDHQIAEHGGLDGIRDRGAVESALSKPENLALYAHPDAADLAAAYAFALVRNHGFVDGNKRTAWVMARLFLLDNLDHDWQFTFEPDEAISMMEALAAGQMDEKALAQWFRERIQKFPPHVS